MSDEIRAKIEQEMKGRDSGIVTIKFSAEELGNLKVREDIHNAFNAEIIGNDLFIKFDSGGKEAIHYELVNSFKNQCKNQEKNWWTSFNTICVVGSRELRPDLGVWFRKPTFPQMFRPLISSCPHPNVWIEVFYNYEKDRDHAFENINWLQENTIGVEFVAIAVPYGVTPFHSNPEPEAGMAQAISQLTRPTRAPYICHWDSNYNEIWYRMEWNRYIALRCGLVIEFNIVLNILAGNY
ncbi:2037_t:CDS:2 [Diversispora eburnea]|uniref:2037_t:CDS:1 n=1 Tax=Diversispora eburnea TaxID=1213867 RepID=A0A9N9CJQ6_9GLOM|nr:2037_t:CDS:2 [Diversispora eburnea]